jgi:hypothetical protein
MFVIGLSSLVMLFDGFLEAKFKVRDFERIGTWLLIAIVLLIDRLLDSESVFVSMFVFLEKFEGTPLDIKPFLDSPLLLF